MRPALALQGSRPGRGSKAAARSRAGLSGAVRNGQERGVPPRPPQSRQPICETQAQSSTLLFEPTQRTEKAPVESAPESQL